MVAQRRVGIVLLETVLHEIDQLGSLDRLRGIPGENVRQDFFKLVAKIHKVCGSEVEWSSKIGEAEGSLAFLFMIQTPD